MASLRVLAFNHEGRPVAFDTCLDDLQLYLLSDTKDSVSLFDHVSGAATAPPATADNATRSQWLSRDAAPRLAIRNHLPVAECAHFGQHRTAQALYDAVVACYSSPATAALGRLLLPYLFPELSAFALVEDLVSHLRASDARYRAVLPAEFLAGNPPPMDHFLSLDPTSLTVDLLEQHFLTTETCAVAVDATRGTPRPPFFEGCSPSLLASSYASAAAVDVSVAEDVGAASAIAKCHSSKGKDGKVVGVAAVVVEAAVGIVEGMGVLVAAVGAAVGVAAVAAVGLVAVGLALGMLVLEVASVSSSSVGARPSRPNSFLYTQHRCFSRLDDAWRAEFRDDVELPRWADQLRSRTAIFDLDFDAILSAMYALSVSAEGVCYHCVPPDPGIATAALGASESDTLSGTAPAQALHTFTTTLTLLPAPVPIRLGDPSGGPVVARSSTVLPCPAVPSGSLSGLHLPSFSTNLVSASLTALACPVSSFASGSARTFLSCVSTLTEVVSSSPTSYGTLHAMALRPSSVPLRVPLPPPHESSLPEVPDSESYRARAPSPTFAHLLATIVTDPSFESAAASALSASASPLSVGGECALGTDVLEDRREDFKCLAAAVPRFASMLLASEGDPDAPDIPTLRSYAVVITGPYSSQWQAAMDDELASWKSTSTYVDEVPPPGANIVDGMWIFRVKQPPGSLAAFKARYISRGFSQRQGVDYFQTFSHTPKMTTLWVLLHVAAQRDYELHSLDFRIAFLQGSLHKEIWLRRPPGFI
ncbi:unnamed protein product [Closterium sp. NIES-53]